MIIAAVTDSVLLLALLPHSAGPYAALVLIGFGIGILGHLSGARLLVVAGILLIALGAFLFPLAVEGGGSPPSVRTSP
jgi:hypothetical protein